MLQWQGCTLLRVLRLQKEIQLIIVRKKLQFWFFLCLVSFTHTQPNPCVGSYLKIIHQESRKPVHNIIYKFAINLGGKQFTNLISRKVRTFNFNILILEFQHYSCSYTFHPSPYLLTTLCFQYHQCPPSSFFVLIPPISVTEILHVFLYGFHLWPGDLFPLSTNGYNWNSI